MGYKHRIRSWSKCFERVARPNLFLECDLDTALAIAAEFCSHCVALFARCATVWGRHVHPYYLLMRMCTVRKQLNFVDPQDIGNIPRREVPVPQYRCDTLHS